MRFFKKFVLLFVSLGALLAYAQHPAFQHIVVIVQENRTPDNLFGGITSRPSTWDVQPVNGATSVPLSSCIDPNHMHVSPGWLKEYDNGNYNNWCKTQSSCTTLSCPQETVVTASTMTPYLNIGQYYSFANRMFQTNQGPSFPAHQFLLTGTSAPTQPDNPPYNAWFAAENPNPPGNTGCTSPQGEVALEIDPSGHEGLGFAPTEPWPASAGYPCYDHPTLTDLLNGHSISWKYYTPNAGSIWTAPNSILHMCQPSGGSCNGHDWTDHVVLDPRRALADILDLNCNDNALPQVSWVIPSFAYSDHGGDHVNGFGPDWVASLVNGIGTSPCGYWNNTAIIITWDDWGGFYDHVHIPQPFRNQYELGFRVPLLVVSAYTGVKNPDGSYSGYVSCPVPVGSCQQIEDFGSILQFIESNFGLPNIAPGAPFSYADAQARALDPGFFGLSAPRPFQTILTLGHDANFFLGNTLNPHEDPDDD